MGWDDPGAVNELAKTSTNLQQAKSYLRVGMLANGADCFSGFANAILSDASAVSCGTDWRAKELEVPVTADSILAEFVGKNVVREEGVDVIGRLPCGKVELALGEFEFEPEAVTFGLH